MNQDKYNGKGKVAVSVGKNWRNWNSYTLIEKRYDGAVTFEKSLELSQRVKHSYHMTQQFYY